MSKRLKGTTVSKSIVYGSSSQPILKKEAGVDPSHTHRWTVFVRGAHGEDISVWVKKVIFKLHDSFPNPSRVIEQPPYEVTETGWGEFEIGMRIYFQDTLEKPQSVYHHLQLYPKGDVGMQIKKAITAENYDELVFNEPTEELHALLTLQPSDSNKPHPQFTEAFEQEEADKIIKAQEQVMKMYEEHKQQLQKADLELKETLAKIKVLEAAA